MRGGTDRRGREEVNRHKGGRGRCINRGDIEECRRVE